MLAVFLWFVVLLILFPTWGLLVRGVMLAVALGYLAASGLVALLLLGSRQVADFLAGQSGKPVECMTMTAWLLLGAVVLSLVGLTVPEPLAAWLLLGLVVLSLAGLVVAIAQAKSPLPEPGHATDRPRSAAARRS